MIAQDYDDYCRDMAGIASEMIGAGRYLADHPEYGTDERVAEVFREYLAKMDARRRTQWATVDA